MNKHASSSSTRIALALIFAAAMTSAAFADSRWTLEFEFDGPGGLPAADSMRNYILGCVPKGSHVPPVTPRQGPQGPFVLTTPQLGKRELTDPQVYNYLNGCNLKPASVTGIVVLGAD